MFCCLIRGVYARNHLFRLCLRIISKAPEPLPHFIHHCRIVYFAVCINYVCCVLSM